MCLKNNLPQGYNEALLKLRKKDPGIKAKGNKKVHIFEMPTVILDSFLKKS